uniref:Putative secreted protein n=1 Tax=Ixodes ricinus TaxID=34613 RepID=A0A6B0UBZ8_IXORI
MAFAKVFARSTALVLRSTQLMAALINSPGTQCFLNWTPCNKQGNQASILTETTKLFIPAKINISHSIDKKNYFLSE